MTLEANRIRLIMELRKQGIKEPRVLSVIERTPRELFIPETFQDQAYENMALPIGNGQTISQPAVVAFMTQELDVGPRMKVLEIGTGSGYQAAILAKLCRRLYSIERHKDLLDAAEKQFRALRINNITTKLGDGTKGWIGQAPFDRIIVTAAASRQIPRTLIDQLAPTGTLIAPMGETGRNQNLFKFYFDQGGEVKTDKLWPVRFVPLIGESESKYGG
ncbi:MAG: Protein-L-isoaspartate O-methyltransferase [Alphaproteobacteria bacterium MarineAlpha11_Bin1]|nr:MAG: Protein-L-isoaspartate O-methyltransferase [Alphaproteobacteria bacterium MarineAlpha11_Bin1]|tara:strand:+ start:3878 stop:4531 length:654 start_codon:yes stop_codon:yes gene_type:complete